MLTVEDRFKYLAWLIYIQGPAPST